MLEKQKFEGLSETIKKETGDLSVDAIAEKAGLSKKLVARLLSDEAIYQPSQKTLSKIAFAFPLLDAEKLYKICDYYFGPIERLKTIKLFPTAFYNVGKDDDEITSYMTEKINEGFGRLIEEGGWWTLLGSFFDEFFTRYGTGVKCIKVIKDIKENPSEKERGEYVISCCMYWEYRLQGRKARKAGMHFVLYCNKVNGDNLVFTDVSTTGRDLYDTESLPDFLLNKIKANDINVDDAARLVFTTDFEERNFLCNAGEEDECFEKLCDGMNETTEEEEGELRSFEYVNIVTSVGCSMTESVTVKKVADYILENSEYLLESPEQVEAVESLLELLEEKGELATEDEIEDIFSDYFCYTALEDYADGTMFAPLVDILNGKAEEKQLDLVLEYCPCDEVLDMLPCIYIPEEVLGLYDDSSMLKEVEFLNEELVPLGFRKAGDILAYMSRSIEDKNEYSNNRNFKE